MNVKIAVIVVFVLRPRAPSGVTIAVADVAGSSSDLMDSSSTSVNMMAVHRGDGDVGFQPLSPLVVVFVGLHWRFDLAWHR